MIAAADSDTMSWRTGLSWDVRGVTTTIGSVSTDNYHAFAHLDSFRLWLWASPACVIVWPGLIMRWTSCSTVPGGRGGHYTCGPHETHMIAHTAKVLPAPLVMGDRKRHPEARGPYLRGPGRGFWRPPRAPGRERTGMTARSVIH